MQTYVKIYSDIGGPETGPVVNVEHEPTRVGSMLVKLDATIAESDIMTVMRRAMAARGLHNPHDIVQALNDEPFRSTLIDDAFELIWCDNTSLEELLELAVEAFTYESVE
jgi:hypothetical protein